jgi:hypothetical protein
VKAPAGNVREIVPVVALAVAVPPVTGMAVAEVHAGVEKGVGDAVGDAVGEELGCVVGVALAVGVGVGVGEVPEGDGVGEADLLGVGEGVTVPGPPGIGATLVVVAFPQPASTAATPRSPRRCRCFRRPPRTVNMTPAPNWKWEPRMTRRPREKSAGCSVECSLASFHVPVSSAGSPGRANDEIERHGWFASKNESFRAEG